MISTIRVAAKIKLNCRINSSALKLFDLPATTTLSKLRESLKEIKYKKIDLEPGCVVHFRNEAEAEYFVLKLKNLHPTLKVMQYQLLILL